MIENISILIKSILTTRAIDGATISEIESDLYELAGCELKIFESSDISTIKNFLQNIPGVFCEQKSNGPLLWYIKSKNSMHINKMIREQKSASNWRLQHSDETNNISDENNNRPLGSCYFKDNYRYKYKKLIRTAPYKSRQFNKYKSFKKTSCKSFNENFDAHFYDYKLLGDDFLMSFAATELDCRIYRYYSTTGRYIENSGLCKSGQTIRDAIHRLNSTEKLNKKMIINLGSVDILHGHDLLDIKNDFRDLIKVLMDRGITPIITTLAPLSNLEHMDETRKKLLLFNKFLRDNYVYVADLWTCMVSQNNKKILFECFEEPEYVTGSNQPHAIWSMIGKQRVYKYLKQRIGYLDVELDAI